MNTNSGIYKITSPSGKCYIGSAVNFQNRWNTHRWQLKYGKHGNQKLQRAYNKYGEDNLHFTKLIYCEKKNLILYEQLIMNALKPEYNICQVAGSRLGMKHTIEVKEILRKKAKIRYTSDEVREKARQQTILQFSNPDARKLASENQKRVNAGRSKIEIAKNVEVMAAAVRGKKEHKNGFCV